MTASPQPDIGVVARSALAAGISLVPPAEDGSKRPDGAWKRFQTALPTLDQVDRWYSKQKRTGLGFVTGSVSEGLELFEFDADLFAEFKEAADAVGLGPLLEKIESGYLERSPAGGWHLLYKCEAVRGNTKLARAPGPVNPKTGLPTVEVLIETRGEGGYAIVAPSNGRVHPTGGRYELLKGGPSTIATIGVEERDSLWSLARTFDRMPPAAEEAPRPASRRPEPGDSEARPGDDFNSRATWDEVLGTRGWTRLYTRGDTAYWRRPGKAEGWSATTNRNGSGLLWVFSTSTEFVAERSYDRFGAFAVLEAGGDLAVAARTLAKQGYGTRERPVSMAGGGGGKAYVIPLTRDGSSPAPNEADDDPHRLARLYRDVSCYHQDGPTLVYHKGEFLRWDRAYRPVLEQDIRAQLGTSTKSEFDRLNLLALAEHATPRANPPKSEKAGEATKGPPTVKKVTSSLVANVSLALAGYSLLPSQVDAPAWLCDGGPWPALEILPARNGLLHLPSFAAGKPAFIPPTPNFFCPYALDFDFDPRARTPSHWHEFLLKLWDDDPESVATLQEWFAYHLSSDVSQQKIGVLIGPRRSGKSTIARVLTAMIGRANVCNPTLSALGTQFGSAVLIGKLAAIITDARISGRTDIAQVVENLLSISGEDSKSIPRKHLPDWDGKLSAKFTIISNETPRLADSSGALAGRMVILKLTRSFYGQEDHHLFEKLVPELPGILLWAIAGWKRLQERGHFLQPESGNPLVEEMAELSSPIGTFVRDCCSLGAGSQIEIDKLFGAWKEWCHRMNREQVGDQPAFGRNLRTVIPTLATKPVKEKGKFHRVFQGIDLLPPEF